MSCNLVDLHTIQEHKESLAKYLPQGFIWTAKNIGDSVMSRLLLGLSRELSRVEVNQDELGCEYNINQTDLFLTEWESAVGIPSACMTTGYSVEQRRKNIIIKLGLQGVTTKQDFIKVASLLGYNVSIIEGGAENSGFPYTFPITFYPSRKYSRFTMIVYLEQSAQPNVFPYTFPITFTTEGSTNILECIFNKLKPANTTVLFRYTL